MKYFLEIIIKLRKKIELLEKAITSKDKQTLRRENNTTPSIHSMEVKEEHRVQNEERGRNAMNDQKLRVDLEKKYGKTKWALKLINEILFSRTKK